MIFLVLIFAAEARRRSRRRHAKNDWDFGYERDILDSPYLAVPAARMQSRQTDRDFAIGQERGRILRLLMDVAEREGRRRER